MDNFAIVGNGIVGNATGNLFGIKKRFDIEDSKRTASLDEIGKCEYIFICLPTEVDDEGKYNVKEILDIIFKINNHGKNPTFVIRSTVYPGFARHIKMDIGAQKIISNPEFLSQDSAEKDEKSPPFVILGGEPGDYINKLKGYYQARVKGSRVILTDNITAEMAKLTMNGYFATKVIFANQIFDVCQSMGINYETVKKILESHPFGPRNHFDIWYKGKRGVNGKCLPKDSKALAYYTNAKLIEKVVQLNESYINLKP